MRLSFALAPLVGVVFAVVAAAAEPSLDVTQAWARATAPNATTAAAYITITNHSMTDDTLTAASTPVAGKAELHESQMDNGVMKMTPLAGVPVKMGATVTFQPGHLHIMLTGLKKPLHLGDSFPLTLTFAKAGAITTTVTIAKDPPAGMHDMPGMKM